MTELPPGFKNRNYCNKCDASFRLFVRRHHCRNCGETFCNSCSAHSIAIPKYNLISPVRVCTACFDKLEEEQHEPKSAQKPKFGDRNRSVHQLIAKNTPARRRDSVHVKLNPEVYYVLQEVLSTEEMYCAQLTSLLQHYLVPLTTERASLIKNTSTEGGQHGPVYFSINSLRSILNLHVKLLSDMKVAHQVMNESQAAFEPSSVHSKLLAELMVKIQAKGLVPKNSADQETDDDDSAGLMMNKDMAIISVLHAYIEHLKIYRPYVQLFRSVTLQLGQEHNSRLQLFLVKTAKKHKHQSVNQLLIAPIQRIPRYVLLLDRLSEHLPPNHDAITLVQETASKMRVVADMVDKCQKQAENAAMLLELQKRVVNIPDDFVLLTPSRTIHRYDKLVEVTSNTRTLRWDRRKAFRVVLCNDCLIILNQAYEYLERVDVSLLDVTKSTTKDTLFTLSSGFERKSVHSTWICRTANACAAWVKSITNATNSAKEDANAHYRRRSVHVPKPSKPGLSFIEDDDGSGGASAMSLDGVEAVPVGSKEGRSGSTTSNAEMPFCETVNLFLRVRPFVTELEKKANLVCLQSEGNLATLQIISDTEAYAGSAAAAAERAAEADNNVAEPADGTPEPRTGVREKAVVYDEVFSADCSQEQVFDRVGEEILGAVFSGYNAAIMAYGHTGTGKTYTMYGDTDLPETMGLIPRMLTPLMFMKGRSDLYDSCSIRLSYFQIHKGCIQDLLYEPGTGAIDTCPNKLCGQRREGMPKFCEYCGTPFPVVEETEIKIVESKNGRTEVKGLREMELKNRDDAMALIIQGNSNRAVRSHLMNEQSSRSHTICIINVASKRKGTTKLSKSCLYLVDLAGSENAKETGIKGDALVEAHYIMRSLTSLGRVVHTLTENKKRALQRRLPVPFRESTLTRVLKNVLMGEFVCSVILNTSPSPVHGQDILSEKTMTFGEGIRRLKVNARRMYGSETTLTHWLKGLWRNISTVPQEEAKVVVAKNKPEQGEQAAAEEQGQEQQATKGGKVASWAIGDACWGRWDDGHYYIAEIIDIAEDGTFSLNFIEYGEIKAGLPGHSLERDDPYTVARGSVVEYDETQTPQTQAEVEEAQQAASAAPEPRVAVSTSPKTSLPEESVPSLTLPTSVSPSQRKLESSSPLASTPTTPTPTSASTSTTTSPSKAAPAEANPLKGTVSDWVATMPLLAEYAPKFRFSEWDDVLAASGADLRDLLGIPAEAAFPLSKRIMQVQEEFVKSSGKVKKKKKKKKTKKQDE